MNPAMSEASKLGPARQGSILPASFSSDALLDEQNASWREGQRVAVEAFLERCPSLRLDEECLLDLLYNEIRLREEAGETPTLEEYDQRFPQLGESLRVQFQVHQVMRPGEALAEFARADAARFSRLSPLPVIPGFEVLGELGRGAMAVVYKARHLRLNRLTALKMILAGPHAGPRERARFETEARAVARLQHPHIVQIHEIGEQGGRPFLCMELVSGGNLAEHLAAGPLPFRQAAELTELLARAVHHAHEHQILHRDLKPANVLLTPSDSRRGIKVGAVEGAGYFEPKIADFGLAKLLDRPLDSSGGTFGSGGPIGTAPYMAPEQAVPAPSGASGKRDGNGRATDVYALGAILYEMLTGRPPFLAATVFDTLQQVMSLDPVAPRCLQPKVQRDLEAICLACLRKEPRRRYATALDLADDLRRFLEGKPIRQRPPAPWEPAVKWARRRPSAAAWILLGFAGLVGLAASGLYYVEHRQEWARQGALDRYEKFLQHRDEALFQGTLLTAIAMASPDQASTDLHATQETARQALSLAGFSVAGEAGLPRDAHLTAVEQANLTNSCYELLLILAQAVGQPLPDMSVEEKREQAAQGLRILDRANQLGSPTRAFCLCQARQLARQGDQSGSDAARQQAEAIQPVSASDFYLTGVDRYQDGDTPGAIQSFHDALGLQPSHFEAQCFLAICSLNAGRPGEARIGLTACIGQRPRFAWCFLLRGVAAVQEQAYADAEADFTTARNLDASGLVGFAVHANRGRALLRQGKLEEAIVDLDKAAALRPQECHAYILLAQAFQRRKQYAEADRALETALRLRPNLPLVHRTRAELLWERGQLDDALRHYEKTIALERQKNASPILADDYVARGRIYHAQGRFADAVAAYDEALRIAPKLARAHYFRGESLLALSRFAEAEQAFGECLRNEPAFGQAFRKRGLARVRQGHFAEAIEDYTEALHLQRDASILEHLGWAYFFTEAWKLAEQTFEESIKIDGKPGDAHVGRGLARAMLGDYRRAVADAETVLGKNKPDTPEMMHNVACIYALAVARVRSDGAEIQRETLEKRYRQQAIAALRKAFLLVPADKRFTFWQENMRPDSALDAIRPSAEFIKLDNQLRKE
jgi:serine/threonine protein kinase/tetratricopeptide (TPR) repeat protein